MSQPRRRRRRRGRGRGGQSGDAAKKQPQQQQSPGGQGQPKQPQPGTKRRRRRGRGRGQQRQTSPKSSEDLVRALPKERPSTLTAAPDGQTLEGIIGELQSVWGVPQYPQEYRITIKVAEEKDQRGEPAPEDTASRSEPARTNGDGPRREKAPAAPLMRMRGEGGEAGDGAPKKRRRGRRRRRGGGGGGGGSAPSSS